MHLCVEPFRLCNRFYPAARSLPGARAAPERRPRKSSPSGVCAARGQAARKRRESGDRAQCSTQQRHVRPGRRHPDTTMRFLFGVQPTFSRSTGP